MDPGERKGWLEIICAEDLDRHMSAIGQAQANAYMVQEMFREYPLPLGSKLLIPGCGTAQMFDYIAPADLGNNLGLVQLTDLNPDFLIKADKRLGKFQKIYYVLKKDDIEETSLSGKYDGILIVLVLQHVEWQKALQSMLSLNPSRFYIIEQEQDHSQHAVTKSRNLSQAWRRYAEIANPQLVPRTELANFMADKGYNSAKIYEKEVPDNKRMVGFVFDRISLE